MRIAALRALHTRAAVAAGMGIGESGAALRTLSGVAGLIATPAFGYVYQMDSSYPWLVAAGFAVLAEVAFAMLGKEELQRMILVVGDLFTRKVWASALSG